MAIIHGHVRPTQIFQAPFWERSWRTSSQYLEWLLHHWCNNSWLSAPVLSWDTSFWYGTDYAKTYKHLLWGIRKAMDHWSTAGWFLFYSFFRMAILSLFLMSFWKRSAKTVSTSRVRKAGILQPSFPRWRYVLHRQYSVCPSCVLNACRWKVVPCVPQIIFPL